MPLAFGASAGALSQRSSAARAMQQAKGNAAVATPAAVAARRTTTTAAPRRRVASSNGAATPTMPPPPPRHVGVVVVDHGSRRAESNAMLVEFCALYRDATGAGIVEPAHMEIAAPSISDAVGE
jgi:hypothetical protein